MDTEQKPSEEAETKQNKDPQNAEKQPGCLLSVLYIITIFGIIVGVIGLIYQIWFIIANWKMLWHWILWTLNIG